MDQVKDVMSRVLARVLDSDRLGRATGMKTKKLSGKALMHWGIDNPGVIGISDDGKTRWKYDPMIGWVIGETKGYKWERADVLPYELHVPDVPPGFQCDEWELVDRDRAVVGAFAGERLALVRHKCSDAATIMSIPCTGPGPWLSGWELLSYVRRAHRPSDV